jgi:predicted Ser/Thr protein kinase
MTDPSLTPSDREPSSLHLAGKDSLLFAGKKLGDYHILRRLGVGGMAEVYLAEQTSLGRQVALKVLMRDLARDATYVQRFQNEARAAASLVHANIVQIYEVGQEEGIHFIAQEYIRGMNLGEVLKRQGSLQPRLVLEILRQVVAALGKASELGIVHRDIKPENIMLSRSGEVKVADFGLARVQNVDSNSLTQVGVTMGTPLYMSPEQIEGRSLDWRSDIYSLGITCYHLLAGLPPHRGDTALAIAVQHLNTPPEPLENVRSDVPGGMARIIHRLIAKRPEDRYTHPNELLTQLRELAEGAAQQGWGDGPEHWSLAEWVALDESRSQATAQLGTLMKAGTQLETIRWQRGKLMAAAMGALLMGILLAYSSRSQFLLGNVKAAKPEPRSSPWAQLYHAKMTPSEEAWLAVEENFRDADLYIRQLAKQGLIRYYLFVEQAFAKALKPLRQLDAEMDTPLYTFTQAGFCIAYQHLNKIKQAREAAHQLTSERKDQLRRSDPRMFELLQKALNSFPSES